MKIGLMKTGATKYGGSLNPALNAGDDGLTCEICGARMIQRQCKIRCPNCGFTRDCSDP